MEKREVLHVDSEIRPVDREYVLAFFGKSERVKDLCRGIPRRFEYIFVALQKVADGYLGAFKISREVVKLAQKLKKVLHRFAAAGDILLHFIDKRINARGERDIHRSPVAVLGDTSETVVHALPADLYAVSVHKPAYRAGIFLAADSAQLVQ